jgi:hypothetical protein
MAHVRDKLRLMSPPKKLAVIPGQKFGRLTVVEETRKALPSRPGGKRAALCRCDCGTELVVTLSHLTSGRTPSCGCKRRERGHMLADTGLLASWPRPTTHGLASHPLYHTYWNMLNRCEDPSRKDYHNYGGRGITVCAEWHDLTTFITSIEASIGPRPEGMTLDRIDVNGDYEPGNVQWATWEQQAGNRRPRGGESDRTCA